REEVLSSALELAGEIAAKSPVAVQGSKVNLNYARDNGVSQSLEYQVGTTTFGKIRI
ncbi:unnamed protein product, partial [Discosporangium mesarthrocarpum]